MQTSNRCRAVTAKSIVAVGRPRNAGRSAGTAHIMGAEATASQPFHAQGGGIRAQPTGRSSHARRCVPGFSRPLLRTFQRGGHRCPRWHRTWGTRCQTQTPGCGDENGRFHLRPSRRDASEESPAPGLASDRRVALSTIDAVSRWEAQPAASTCRLNSDWARAKAPGSKLLVRAKDSVQLREGRCNITRTINPVSVIKLLALPGRSTHKGQVCCRSMCSSRAACANPRVACSH